MNEPGCLADGTDCLCSEDVLYCELLLIPVSYLHGPLEFELFGYVPPSSAELGYLGPPQGEH